MLIYSVRLCLLRMVRDRVSEQFSNFLLSYIHLNDDFFISHSSRPDAPSIKLVDVAGLDCLDVFL